MNFIAKSFELSKNASELMEVSYKTNFTKKYKKLAADFPLPGVFLLAVVKIVHIEREFYAFQVITHSIESRILNIKFLSSISHILQFHS